MSCHHAAIDVLVRSAKNKEFEMTTAKHAFQVLFALAAALLAAPQAMACYTVYNRANVPVYSNMASPIDMSYQIHERLPAVFPGGHMVFGSSTDCPLIDARTAVPQLSNIAVTAKTATRRHSRTSRRTSSTHSTVNAAKR
jgi:hypothetical protein